MTWGAHLPERVAHPAVVGPLLERALAANPASAALHEKLAYYHLDTFAFSAAAVHLEKAIALDPQARHVRLRLARCYTMLDRPRHALALLAGEDGQLYERGLALLRLGERDAAEREFRAVLAAEPEHDGACRRLCRLLRKAGRTADLLDVCEGLAARGAAGAQLLYNWGWGLALAGDRERTRRLLFERERITLIELAVPEGFADMASFVDALAQELLSNPHQIGDLPEEEANRGSKRIDNLFTGSRPSLIESLLASIQAEVAACPASVREGFDPWPRARPAAARLRPWGLLQRQDDYEAQHIHPSGWLSGVFYVRVPRGVTGGDGGRGCIEFGPPERLAEVLPDAAPTQLYVPREGMLLLAPSHYPHRTIPSGLAEDRISIAFDVVPDGRQA